MFGGIFGGNPGRGAAVTGDGNGGSHAMLAAVRGYWEALREDGAPPRRAAVDPRGLAGALEHAFILERVAPGVARFRIAGMHLADLAGMDVRGMPILSLIDPPARTDFALALEAVFAGPAMLDMGLEAERGIGRPALEGRLLILPLRNNAGEVTLALGCLATTGGIGRAPRRFAIARRCITRLGAADARPAAAAVPVPGMAEAQAPYAAPARPLPGHPHLRLVKG